MELQRIMSALIFIVGQSTYYASIASFPVGLIMLCGLNGFATKNFLRETLLSCLLPLISALLILIIGAVCCKSEFIDGQTRNVAGLLIDWIYKVGLGSVIIPLVTYRNRLGYRFSLASLLIIWLTSFSIMSSMSAKDIWW